MKTEEWIDYCQSRIDDIQAELSKEYTERPLNYSLIDMLNKEYRKWVDLINKARFGERK